MIEALLLVTVGAGTKVVIPEPTFTLYALMTTILGGEPVRVPLSRRPRRRDAPGFVYDVEALLRERAAQSQALASRSSARPTTRPARACRSPTSSGCAATSDALVVIDEAYHEFAGETVVPLLERHPNLVVLRTFSKAMALAGLRVGYLLASPELVREINKARLPYNVNFFSQMAALAALEEKEAARRAASRRLVAERERLLARLADVPGVRAFASRRELLPARAASPADPKAVFASLLRRGVLVRDVTSYPMLVALPARERRHRGGERRLPARAGDGARRRPAWT